MLLKSIQVGALETNCYLVSDGSCDTAVVIDPGANPNKIKTLLEESGLTPCAVFLTHGHFDHTTGVKGLLEYYPGLPVYINAKDLSESASRYAFSPVPGTCCYQEGDVLEFAGLRFSVYETPGHTKGGVVIRTENCLFCGDTLFLESCGRTDLPGGDEEEMADSLVRLSAFDETLKVLPGHGPSSDIAHEKASNPYLHIAQKTRRKLSN